MQEQPEVPITPPHATFSNGEASHRRSKMGAQSIPSFAPDDIAAAKDYTNHPDPKIRIRWISFLTENGPCTWDDLQAWTQDPDENIRWQTFYSMGNKMDAAGYLCASDKPRCISILTNAATKYVDMQIGITMRELVEWDDEWLDLTWQAADRLIDASKHELRTALECGYFEHIVSDSNWGPDDPHILAWIEGDNTKKKMILLRIATYWGVGAGRMRDIVETLSRSTDLEISSLACGILEGRLTHSDIPG